MVRRHLAFLIFVLVIILLTDLPVHGAPVAVGGNASLNNTNTSNASSQASIIDNSGFRTEINGFNFQNYGNEFEANGKELNATDLTAIEMQRMFGDSVIVSRANSKLILTPPAEQWMEMANDAMVNGHCEGMAVLSVLMYYNKISPTKFEGSDAINLSIQKELLQREIAYWWATQVTSPGGLIRVHDSPNAVLNTLIKTFKEGQNATEWWVMGIYKPDGSEGHSVTPFAVENINNGTAKILIYDNNYPKYLKAVEINKTTNTWSYYASINPNEPSELYTGNASTKNLEIVSLSSRLGQQRCDFCDETSDKGITGTKGSLMGNKHTQIWSKGDAHLLITDENGHKTGFLNSGKLINEIPDAVIRNLTFSPSSHGHEPFYSIPVSNYFNIKIDGSIISEAGSQGVWIFSPGSVIGAQTTINPGQQDSITISSHGTNDLQCTYTSTSTQNTVDLTVSLKSNKEDDNGYYEFKVKDLKLDQNGQVSADLNMNDEKLTITTNNDNPGKMNIEMNRVDENGKQTFSNSDKTLQKNDVVSVNFGNYNAGDGTVTADITHEDGVTESVSLNDESGSGSNNSGSAGNSGSNQGNTGVQTISCPNGCSGNGQCDRTTGTCQCSPGWDGLDCSNSLGSHICVNGVCDVPIYVHI